MNDILIDDLLIRYAVGKVFWFLSKKRIKPHTLTYSIKMH